MLSNPGYAAGLSHPIRCLTFFVSVGEEENPAKYDVPRLSTTSTVDSIRRDAG